MLQKLNARNCTPLVPYQICSIFGQLLEAILPMHQSNPPVTHRDLKLENILQSGVILFLRRLVFYISAIMWFIFQDTIKLIDFGSCVVGYTPLRNAEDRSRAEDVIARETTQMYRAPEMVDLFMRDELTEKTDIWALGCIFYTLCFLQHPFQDAGNLGILSAKVNIPHAQNVSSDFIAFVMYMLDVSYFTIYIQNM